jgi:hypothetical protein
MPLDQPSETMWCMLLNKHVLAGGQGEQREAHEWPAFQMEGARRLLPGQPSPLRFARPLR